MNKYIKMGTVIMGITKKYKRFYFDESEYDKVKDYNWEISKCGYVVSSNKDGTFYLHRVIMSLDKGNKMVVDHINHMKTDNRKENLRMCTQMENTWNRENTKGVYKTENNLWRAHILVNGKRKYLGKYKKYKDARKARKQAEDIYFNIYKNNKDTKEKIS